MNSPRPSTPPGPRRRDPPSDVPEDHGEHSPDIAVADLLGTMDHLRLERAHVVGFSMGGFASLIFGLRHPGRALSLVVAGCGCGSEGDRSKFERDVELVSGHTDLEPGRALQTPRDSTL